MRLIDADALIGHLKLVYDCADWDERSIHFSLSDMIANIESEITIEPKKMTIEEICNGQN